QCHHFLSGLLSAVTKRIPYFIGSDLVFNELSDLILNYHKQHNFIVSIILAFAAKMLYFCHRIGNYDFLYDRGCKGEEPPAAEGGCSAAELTPSGTLGFPSEKKGVVRRIFSFRLLNINVWKLWK
ncbi:MAG TPA: hypothetical protein PLT24_01570, partial [Bacillota bacterium]|nr:hypothetical protein [Bacillota bacterium]